MKGLFKVVITLTVLYLLSICKTNAQVLQDSSSLELLKQGISYVYNMQFDEADKIYSKLHSQYSEHPVLLLFRGIETYWKNYPLIPSSPACSSYEETLLKCIELSDDSNDTNKEAEYLLVNLCARGSLLSFYADNDLYMDVFSIATSTYKNVRRSFNFTNTYKDFFFFTGLYNYYREAYPKAHPTYKPLVYFFPKGNKVKGIKDLQTATSSIFLTAESNYFLSLIYSSYENSSDQAMYFSKQLHDLYPANPDYTSMYIKNLLLLKRYNEAEDLIKESNTTISNSYFNSEIYIYKGILQEKKYHDYASARKLYNTGIREIAAFGDYGNDVAAYSYFGLSRISDISGDKYGKKIYRKKANELAYIKKINFDE